jgi:hypothetical protein
VLAREGVSDRTIISYLENRELAFIVGTDEILRLRDAGVGEAVILYIERTAPRDSYASERLRRAVTVFLLRPLTLRRARIRGYTSSTVPHTLRPTMSAPPPGPTSHTTVTTGAGWATGGPNARLGHHSGRYSDRRYDRGWSHGRPYSYGYAGGSSHGYRVSYGRQPGYGYRASSYAHEHAVPRSQGGDGGSHYEGGHPQPSRGHTSGCGRYFRSSAATRRRSDQGPLMILPSGATSTSPFDSSAS